MQYSSFVNSGTSCLCKYAFVESPFSTLILLSTSRTYCGGGESCNQEKIQNRRQLQMNDLLSILMKKHRSCTVTSYRLHHPHKHFPACPQCQPWADAKGQGTSQPISAGTVQPWVHQGTHVLGRWTFYTIIRMNYTLVIAVIRGWQYFNQLHSSHQTCFMRQLMDVFLLEVS